MRITPTSHYTTTGFIAIKAETKEELPVRWEWLTQRSKAPETQYPTLSYQQKKTILRGLSQSELRKSNFQIKDGFSIREKKRAISTASCSSLHSDKKSKPFVYLNQREGQISIPSVNYGVDIESLIKKVDSAMREGNKLLAVFNIRRMGLRYCLKHTFIEYSANEELKDVSLKITSELKELKVKQLYYFSEEGNPLNNLKEISSQDIKVVVVQNNPILHIPYALIKKVKQFAYTLRQFILQKEKLYSQIQKKKNRKDSDSQLEHHYDHQKITNVREYVDKLSQNPEFKLRDRKNHIDQLQKWYKQKYRESPLGERKINDKNVLFQSKCHYPQELINRKLLAEASDKVDLLPITKNRHKLMTERLQLMMEQVKRDQKEEPSRKKDYLSSLVVTKKDMLTKLDRKNTLLVHQNIPYMIEKYGLNRFELHNLYNLYKSFEKIALMRDPTNENTLTVIEKGVDRQTFEAGLKGLDMNPGDQLIKGICYFGDYISWEQFIKIISISLRKTPQQKLSAILKGISQFDTGFLSRHQISMMIGNSLHKLFDHEEQELKEYFSEMAMKEFDPQGSGQVSVETLKSKVLGKGSDNQNMVSFLILNT